jgi:hypothetical protein
VRNVALAVLCAALGSTTGAAQSVSGAATDAPYRVECAPGGPCRADAADARGSSFAPDLTQRMRAMAERDFVAALDKGYFGPQSSMPPRGRDPNVAPYYDELWQFLRARVTGDLPAGPVERLPDAQPTQP